jgi:hypothetical protein
LLIGCSFPHFAFLILDVGRHGIHYHVMARM